MCPLYPFVRLVWTLNFVYSPWKHVTAHIRPPEHIGPETILSSQTWTRNCSLYLKYFAAQPRNSKYLVTSGIGSLIHYNKTRVPRYLGSGMTHQVPSGCLTICCGTWNWPIYLLIKLYELNMVMFPSYLNVMIIEGHQTLGDTLSQNMAAGKKKSDLWPVEHRCGLWSLRGKI